MRQRSRFQDVETNLVVHRLLHVFSKDAVECVQHGRGGGEVGEENLRRRGGEEVGAVDVWHLVGGVFDFRVEARQGRVLLHAALALEDLDVAVGATSVAFDGLTIGER